MSLGNCSAQERRFDVLEVGYQLWIRNTAQSSEERSVVEANQGYGRGGKKDLDSKARTLELREKASGD